MEDTLFPLDRRNPFALICRKNKHFRLSLRWQCIGTSERFVFINICKKGDHCVKVTRCKRIELMIVTLTASHCGTHPDAR